VKVGDRAFNFKYRLASLGRLQAVLSLELFRLLLDLVDDLDAVHPVIDEVDQREEELIYPRPLLGRNLEPAKFVALRQLLLQDFGRALPTWDEGYLLRSVLLPTSTEKAVYSLCVS
jgi:hypothetical protein